MEKIILNKWSEFNVNEIHNILIHNIIACCWGMHNFRNIDWKVLYFNVDGLLFKWIVYIYVKSDLFCIDFIDNNRNIVKTLEWIYIDELIDSIDYIVEKNCSDKAFFPFNPKIHWLYSWKKL